MHPNEVPLQCPNILIFFRSEIDHLSALLLSRTVDNLAGDEKGRSELDTSDKKVAHSRREILTNLPAIENGGERVLPAVISTPVVRSKVGIHL